MDTQVYNSTMRCALLIFGLLLVGCSSAAPTTQPLAGHAECPVCKANCDLACIDVTIESDTPRCQCDGKTVYFCSEACREKFLKNSAKYPR